MHDGEMTPGATQVRDASCDATGREAPRRARYRAPARPSARLAESADAAPRRHEVVVQGMRITLPALRFMEIPPPGSLRR